MGRIDLTRAGQDPQVSTEFQVRFPWMANAVALARERLTLIQLFEELRALGYEGGYAVRHYARAWSREQASQTVAAFVPLSFAPGEAYQFDWNHEIVVMSGVTVTVKVAHVRLCHSRMMFVRAYPRGTQEMVFDARERAFAFFRGACTHGIYDNMKTAVETIFIGKDRQYNRRFLQMCSHYRVDPVACTPASGWEKGEVENQVGLVRERFFAPRLRVKTYDELNAWPADKCLAYAKAHPHPERPEQTVWEVFEEERPNLVPCRGRFDGFHALPASVSKTCLVRFDNNKYSVNASAVGRPVDIHAYADRIVVPQDGRVVAEHAGHHGRGETIYDPWRYVPVLARKPGALRNGARFKDWVLPAAPERVRRKLAGSDDGDRQMVAILATALKRQHEPQRFARDLLKAEISEKQAPSTKYQLTIAKLPLAKDVDGFEFKGTPINESLVRDLAGGNFIAQQRNVVLVGGTGTGKTHSAPSARHDPR
jgi:transposase